jgi:hypothetical protein
MGVFGWSAVGGLIGEGPEVVFRRWGRWWVVVGMRVWVFREVRDGGEGMGLLYGRWERMGNGGEKSNLKMT